VIGFNDVMENHVHGTPPTPVKRFWINVHRWKTLLCSLGRSKILFSGEF